MYRLLPLRISEPFGGKCLPRGCPLLGWPLATFRWNLGGDKDTVTNFLEGPGDQSFAVPIAIGMRGIDKGEAQLQCPRQSPDREGVVGFAPPPLADPPGTKTDLRYLNACASKPE